MKKINLNFRVFIVFFLFLNFLLFSKNDNATEILIYADEITYDSEKNITAKNNAKIIWGNQIITSDIIIYNKKKNKYYFPLDLTYKDKNGNFFKGSSGEFSSKFDEIEINNVKILLNDGSRIVGSKVKRKGNIDIITKAGFTPCETKIKIKNFICPIWQIESEKIIHDNENLILYQKHSKLRLFKTPVLYTPYLVSPSPLRKNRKSGFLLPKIDFNFLNSNVSQSITTPYYFNISEDKELYLDPTIKYGGGVDSSQTIGMKYNQILSGGYLSTDYLMSTDVESQNSNEILKDAFFSLNYNQNLNEHYKISVDTSVQSSRDFLKNNEPNKEINYDNSLKTSANLTGYNLYRFNDDINFNFSTYQSVKNNENDNKIPTVLPFIEYNNGLIYSNNSIYNNKLSFYNILRKENDSELSKKQQKISHEINHSTEFFGQYTKYTFKNVAYTQFFNTEDILIDNKEVSSNSFRFFPATGIFAETPFKFKKYNSIFYPKISLILSPGMSNSHKISNEDSNNNQFNFNNSHNLNRFSGTDKMDNSKRINYGATIINSNLKLDFFQNYEFTNNSNFNRYIGNKGHLSDFLSNINYSKNGNKVNYFLRYDPHHDLLKHQNITYNNNNNLGNLELNYIDEKTDNNNILEDHIETFTYKYNSKKIKKYSDLSFGGIYDMQLDANKEYQIGYNYLDECFGVALSFDRKFYEDGNIKPQDILSIIIDFKHLGSQKAILSE